MPIHIIGSRRYPTVEKLANYLGSTFGKNHVFGKINIAFGWGFGHSILNRRAIRDKLRQLQVLQEARIRCPEVLWIAGTGDPGILLYNNYRPGMGRMRRHTQGKDIVMLRTEDMCRNLDEYNATFWTENRAAIRKDFIVRYVPKLREYRVHVLGGRWVSVSEKKRDTALPPAQGMAKYVWAKRNGYFHVPLDENNLLRQKMGHLAVKAAKALNFDFGAVDIILGEDGNLYVLEINSAPALNDRRIVMYAGYFTEQANKVVAGNGLVGHE